MMTGAKRPKEIIAWLHKNAGSRFRVGMDGWPVVHEKVVEDIFGVKAPRERANSALNLEHLKRRQP